MDPNPELDQHQNLITSRASAYQVWSTFINAFMSRVTTCLENLEMSVNLTAVREMSGILVKIREMSGKCPRKNLVREKLPKTVYCKLHICIHTGIYSTVRRDLCVWVCSPFVRRRHTGLHQHAGQ